MDLKKKKALLFNLGIPLWKTDNEPTLSRHSQQVESKQQHVTVCTLLQRCASIRKHMFITACYGGRSVSCAGTDSDLNNWIFTMTLEGTLSAEQVGTILITFGGWINYLKMKTASLIKNCWEGRDVSLITLLNSIFFFSLSLRLIFSLLSTYCYSLPGNMLPHIFHIWCSVPATNAFCLHQEFT